MRLIGSDIRYVVKFDIPSAQNVFHVTLLQKEVIAQERKLVSVFCCTMLRTGLFTISDLRNVNVYITAIKNVVVLVQALLLFLLRERPGTLKDLCTAHTFISIFVYSTGSFFALPLGNDIFNLESLCSTSSLQYQC